LHIRVNIGCAMANLVSKRRSRGKGWSKILDCKQKGVEGNALPVIYSLLLHDLINFEF